MSKILITGGAGFMGRWVSKNLIDKGHKVWIVDNLSNCTERNVEEFRDMLTGFIIGNIEDDRLLSEIFDYGFEVCIHLAAAVHVQNSIDNPGQCFNSNVIGTFKVLEECRKHNTKIVFTSSALIYETAKRGEKMIENHPLNPSCPYATSKIFGENLVTSYYKTYNLPMVILRPFNIYGPWQKSDSEGGVISIFIERKLQNKPIEIFGDGKQGRDFFYVEDCAEFVVRAAFSENAVGEVLNAGSGIETKIKELAIRIAGDEKNIRFVNHPHYHAEIMNMCSGSRKAQRLLGWEPVTTLEEGIKKTTMWLKSQAKRQDSIVTQRNQ